MSAFMSVRFLFKFFCHVLQKTADGQVLGTDLLAPAALDAVGRPAAGGGVDDVIIVVRVPVVVDLLRVHGGEEVGDGDVLLGLEEGGGQLVRQDIALARVAARQTLAQGQLALALQIAAGRVEVVKPASRNASTMRQVSAVSTFSPFIGRRMQPKPKFFLICSMSQVPRSVIISDWLYCSAPRAGKSISFSGRLYKEN